MDAMPKLLKCLSHLVTRGAGISAKLGKLASGESKVYQSEAAADAFREKNKHRIPQWNADALVLDTWSTGPDSDPGQDFLQKIDADTLHVVALGLNWQNPSTMRWLKALAEHPACDKATAWSLLLQADIKYYEDVIRQAGSRPEFQLADAEIVSLLDILHGRFVAHDFATNEIAPDGGADIESYRLFQKAAADAGQSLHWALPAYAFVLCAGRKPRPKYEVWEAEKIMVPFRQWLTENPERPAARAGNAPVPGTTHQR